MADHRDMVEVEDRVAEIGASEQAGVTIDIEADFPRVRIAVPEDRSAILDLEIDGSGEHFRQGSRLWRRERPSPDMASGQPVRPRPVVEMESDGVVDDDAIGIVAVAARRIDGGVPRQSRDDAFEIEVRRDELVALSASIDPEAVSPAVEEGRVLEGEMVVVPEVQAGSEAVPIELPALEEEVVVLGHIGRSPRLVVLEPAVHGEEVVHRPDGPQDGGFMEAEGA